MRTTPRKALAIKITPSLPPVHAPAPPTVVPAPNDPGPSRRDQKRCPRCHDWGCPTYGTQYRAEGVIRYRNCGSCGHRFATQQRHGSTVEDIIA